MTAPIANAGAWPKAPSRVRFEQDGRIVEVTISWTHIQSMARRALNQKTHTCVAGPVHVREVAS